MQGAYRLFFLCALALGALAAPPAPGRAEDRPSPTGRVEDLLVFVQSVARSQDAGRQFSADGASDGGRQSDSPVRCNLRLGFLGPRPGDGYRVLSVTPIGDPTDDAGEPLAVSRAQLEGPESAASPSPVLYVTGVTPRSRAIRQLDLEVSLAASAQLVSLEVPWRSVVPMPRAAPAPPLETSTPTLSPVGYPPPPAGEAPPHASASGVTATIEESVQEPTGLRIRLRIDHPETAALSWSVSPRGGPITLQDEQGEPLPVESVNFLGGDAGARYRVYRLQYPGLKRPPAKVAVLVLLRAGPVTSVPVRLKQIPLPDFTGTGSSNRPALGLPFDEAAATELAAAVTVDGKPAGPGILAIGLQPLAPEGEAGKPPAGRPGWRWIEVPTDADGRARLPHLKPGRYRVWRFWRPVPGTPARAPDPFSWVEPKVTVEIRAGAPTVLPPLAAAGPAAR
jgi:hypothetical protein